MGSLFCLILRTKAIEPLLNMPTLTHSCGRRTVMVPTTAVQCPLSTATSTGRRNTSIKFLCRGFEPQSLARPFVELSCHFIQMGLRVNRQVSSLGKVLSEQAIGVLVGAALPGALRIAKVHRDVGRQSKPPMIRKLLAPVPGQSLASMDWRT